MLTCVNWLEYVRQEPERYTVDRYAAAIASSFYDDLDLRHYEFARLFGELREVVEDEQSLLREHKSLASTPMTPEQYRAICTIRRYERDAVEKVQKF